MDEKCSLTGIAGIMNDQHFNLVPEGLTRLNRRKDYNQDPEHTTLKDKRSKRDELKDKKFKALTQKEIEGQKPANEGTSAETMKD
jgi:lysine 2,3-aminomutase